MNLAEIAARAEAATKSKNLTLRDRIGLMDCIVSEYVPALIAEVERLREENRITKEVFETAATLNELLNTKFAAIRKAAAPIIKTLNDLSWRRNCSADTYVIPIELIRELAAAIQEEAP